MQPHSQTPWWFTNQNRIECIDGINYKLCYQESSGSAYIKWYGYAAMAKHNRHTARMKLSPDWVFVFDDEYKHSGDIMKSISEDLGIKTMTIKEFEKRFGSEKAEE